MHPHLIYILTIFCKSLHYNLLAVLDVETLVEVLEALAYVLSVYGVYAVVCLCAFNCYETDACSRVAYVSCVRHVRLAVSACLCCADVSNLYVHYSHLAVLHVCRSIELSREVVVNSVVNLDIVDEETCRKSLCVEVRTDVAVLYACVANASEVDRYRTPAN